MTLSIFVAAYTIFELLTQMWVNSMAKTYPAVLSKEDEQQLPGKFKTRRRLLAMMFVVALIVDVISYLA